MMASSSSSSGPSRMRCAPIVAVRTQKCLEEIRNMPSEELASVIILIGKTGVGKSALLEYLTNAVGHTLTQDGDEDFVQSVTLDFQLESVDLPDKRYYIIDTPGFDTDNEQASFREIVRGIEAVRDHAKIVGVMLVTRINDTRVEAADNRLVDFVDKLCGPEYTAQITVVTNFWNVAEPVDKIKYERRLEKCLLRWRAVFGQELKQYQHGRRYNSSVEDVGECLKWNEDRDDIRSYAKAIITCHYGGINPRDPAIVQELSRDRSLDKTAAGEFLGIAPSPHASSSPTFATPPGQAEATTQPLATSEPEGEEIPAPPASSHTVNPNPNPSQFETHPEPPGPSLLQEGLTWVVNNVVAPVVRQAVNDMLPRVTIGGTNERFPGHLDPLSSRDHFLARGLPGDLGFRTQWAQEHGITLEPGSQAFGDAVRNAIIRERPL